MFETRSNEQENHNLHYPDVICMYVCLDDISVCYEYISSHHSRLVDMHFVAVFLQKKIFVSSVRSSNSHPDLLVTQQHHPTFPDHTGP